MEDNMSLDLLTESRCQIILHKVNSNCELYTKNENLILGPETVTHQNVHDSQPKKAIRRWTESVKEQMWSLNNCEEGNNIRRSRAQREDPLWARSQITIPSGKVPVMRHTAGYGPVSSKLSININLVKGKRNAFLQWFAFASYRSNFLLIYKFSKTAL